MNEGAVAFSLGGALLRATLGLFLTLYILMFALSLSETLISGIYVAGLLTLACAPGLISAAVSINRFGKRAWILALAVTVNALLGIVLASQLSPDITQRNLWEAGAYVAFASTLGCLAMISGPRVAPKQ